MLPLPRWGLCIFLVDLFLPESSRLLSDTSEKPQLHAVKEKRNGGRCYLMLFFASS